MRSELALGRADARVKIALVAGALGIALTADRPLQPLLVGALAWASLLASQVPLRRIGRALLGLALAVLVPMGIVAWLRGPGAAALIFARVLGATSASLWLVASTELYDLQAALAWLGLPLSLVEMLGLAHRYLGVFGDTLRTARDAQTIRLGYAGRARALRSVGALAGIVFGRAIDQAEILSDALALRGYRGTLWVAAPPRLQAPDARLALLGALALALVAAIGAW